MSLNLFKSRILFDADAGGGGGTAEDDKEVTLKQAELNRQFGERAKRASEAALKAMLTTLGFDSEQALKDALAAAKTAKEADDRRKQEEMTELDRTKAALAAAEAAKTAEAAKVAVMQEQLKLNAIRSAVLAAATDFIDPQDAWEKVDKAKLSLDDSGKVVGLEEALKPVREKRHLLRDQKKVVTPTPNGRKSAAKKEGESVLSRQPSL